MKSVMAHQFARVPSVEIPRSTFDRSHGHKTTFDAGYLVPVFIDEALPGDTFNLRMDAFARFATPIKPVMDNLFLDSFFFAVPARLVWNNWQRMNGEQDNPGDSTDFRVPIVQHGSFLGFNPLIDYFGIPQTDTSDVEFNALPFRAYNLIYNEWFRDQNLQDSVDVPKGDGPDSSTLYTLRRRGKRHDYFTSCLPWPQKGPDVLLPLGLSAPINGTGNVALSIPGQSITFRDVGNATFTPYLNSGGNMMGPNDDAGNVSAAFPTQGVNIPRSDIAAGLHADLTSATAVTINALREAIQMQRLYERDARGGTRYTEIILSHFGVRSPDARLQRPEYLGGGSSPVNIHPVPQTAGTGVAGTPQGNLAAFGTASIHGHSFSKSFTEHCYIIGLVCVRADLTYQQGLNRMWSRRTRWDHYWPALSHLGEQVVHRREIFSEAGAGGDTVFGYQERYAEYRYKPSLITGKFRSTDPQSLDVWHLSQDFAAAPALNADFIVENPPIGRVIAVPSEPHFLADFYFNLKCARPMPVFGVPGYMDHF